MTQDEEFIKSREKMRMEKSKNVFQGVGKGFKMVGVGVFEGITGRLRVTQASSRSR